MTDSGVTAGSRAASAVRTPPEPSKKDGRSRGGDDDRAPSGDPRPVPAAEWAKTQPAVTRGASPLRRYQDVVVGQRSLAATLYFEFCMLLAGVPGALGLVLRKVFWPRLFRACGRGVQFGTGVILRHPNRIRIGDRVVISERCTLDARNPDADEAIVIGDDAILAEGVMLQTKGGTIRVGAHVGINSRTLLNSTVGCFIEVGNDSMIGPRCVVLGGGGYEIDGGGDRPMSQRPTVRNSGARLADDVWLGAHVTVVTGVTMETGSVAAAGAVVTKDVPARAVCGGVPARVLRKRRR